MNKNQASWALAAALSLAGGAEAATVTLDWSAVTTNADGTGITDLAGYRVFHATFPLTSMTTAQAMTAPTVGKYPGAGQTVNGVTAAVPGLADGTTIYFRVTAVDVSGNQSSFSELPLQVSTFTPAAPGPGPSGFGSKPGLRQAYVYPNPAKGVDPVIRAMMGDVEYVEVTIFDQSGRAVHSGRSTAQVTVSGEPAHEYRWTGAKSPGVYHAVIHGRKGDETVRARAKFAVVR